MGVKTYGKDPIFDELVKSQTLEKNVQSVQGGSVPSLAYPTTSGRTVINGLGDRGRFSKPSDWLVLGGTFVVTNSIAVITGNGATAYPQIYNNPTKGLPVPKLGDTVLIRGRGRCRGVTPASIRLVLYSNTTTTDVVAHIINSPTLDKWYEFSKKIVVTQSMLDGWAAINIRASAFYANATTANGKISEFTDIAMYFISTSESTLSETQLITRYPYVGTGINGVKNLTITAVQDNLLPTFDEWTLSAGSVIVSPYVIQQTNPSGSIYADFVRVPAEPNTAYNFAITGTGRHYMVFEDETGNIITGEQFVSETGNVTVTSPAETARILIVVGNMTAGTHTFSNPMLVKGVTKPFKPQRKTELTVYTELHSSADMSAKDTMLYVDGEPKKSKQFEKIILDGALDWGFQSIQTGHKGLKFSMPENYSHSIIATKNDGTILGWGLPQTLPNLHYTDYNKYYVSVANVDSGWGNDYTPTTAEVKAYFYGWRIEQSGIPNVPYNGTGTKAWVNPNNSENWTNIVPGGPAAGHTPYQLLYQRARPILEEITTVGAVVLEAGSNQVRISSTNMYLESVSLTYTDSLYSAISYVERELVKHDHDRKYVKREGDTIDGTFIMARGAGVYGANNVNIAQSLARMTNIGTKEYAYLGGRASATIIASSENPKFYDGASTLHDFWHAGNNAVSLLTNGYQKLASGLIIQWGSGSVSANNASSFITFPTGFPNACLSVTGTVNSAQAVPLTIGGTVLTGFNAYMADTINRSCRWIAIGY